jgi:hypothetical protein
VKFNLNVGTGPTPTTTTAPTTPTTTSPAATATAVVTAPAAIFKDSFEDPKSGWIEYKDQGFSMGYVDGKYQIVGDANVRGQISPDHVGQPNLTNSRTEIEFESDNPNAVFVMHVYAEYIPGGPPPGTPVQTLSNESEYFYLAFSPVEVSGYASIKQRRLRLPTTALDASSFKPVNKVVIEARGEPGQQGSLKAWLNGRVVMDVAGIMPKGTGVFPVFEAGRGLGAKSTIKFDNLVVTKLT